jgi:hypothetical protein
MSQLLLRSQRISVRWASIDGASSSCRPASSLGAARGFRASSRAAAHTSPSDSTSTEEGFVEAGWLWSSNGKPGGSSATRINLRDSGIKAKKCAPGSPRRAMGPDSA